MTRNNSDDENNNFHEVPWNNKKGSRKNRKKKSFNNYKNQRSTRGNNYNNQRNFERTNRRNNYDNQRVNNYDNQRRNNYDNQRRYNNQRINNYDNQRVNNYDNQRRYDNQRVNNYDNCNKKDKKDKKDNNYNNQRRYDNHRVNNYDNCNKKDKKDKKDNNYKNIRIDNYNNYNNKNKKKNKNKKSKNKRHLAKQQEEIIIEFNTIGKNIPIQNFPFKEILNDLHKKNKFNNKKGDKKLNVTSEESELVKQHKKYEEEEEESIMIDSDDEFDELDITINSITDLIKLGRQYKKEDKNKYAFNLKKLNKIIEPLEKLDNTIGMDHVKKSITDQLVYILQKFDKEEDMLHTVIEGPPGVGKTMLGKILAEIYYNLGIIKKKKIEKEDYTNTLFNIMGQLNQPTNKPKKSNEKFPFKVVRRSDLIGQYLGQTAQKTQDAIDEANGGVLFIDEAYSLGSEDLKDSYAKECIDTINQNLSENKGNFICIIAGYPKELEKYFFSQNRGLERRFVFRYKIDKYTSEELSQILISKIKNSNWKLSSEFNDNYDELINLIKANTKKFNNFGGDIETFFLKCKIAHSNRIFGKHPKLRKKLTIQDFKNGIELFLQNKKLDEDKPLNMMYT